MTNICNDTCFVFFRVLLLLLTFFVARDSKNNTSSNFKDLLLSVSTPVGISDYQLPYPRLVGPPLPRC